jgi:hypothetical protein
MRAIVATEGAGIPAVAIVATGFAPQATLVGRALGCADPALACYPGVIVNDDHATLVAKVLEHLLPAVMRGLVAPVDGDTAASATRPSSATETYDADRIVLAGDLDAVHAHFDARGWTDGLPIIPPTRDRVERMLAHTGRDPHSTIAVLAPAQVVATPWNVAVNAVMAGCPPILMPLLLATVEAVGRPEFRLEDGGSTPGWEPLIVVSGPDTEQYGLHHGAGVMRVGVKANTTMGRFLRLYLRNVAGLRTPPAGADKAAIGMSFNVAMVENDRAVHALGWPSLREDGGFDRNDTVVAVQSVVGISTPIYSAGTTADPHIDVLAEHLVGVSAHWAGVAVIPAAWWPLLALSPDVAAVLARNGVTPRELREGLAQRALAPARLMADYVAHTGVEYFDWRRFAPNLPHPERYLASDDPDRLVPVLLDPDALGIVVTGDPARNQSRIYVNNHMHGARVLVRVDPRR